MSSFDVGDEVALICEFRVGVALTSQSEVTLQVIRPSGTEVRYTLGLNQITESSPGVYRRNLVLDRPGRWLYRFTATGSYRGTTGNVVVNVDPSPFSSV
jgi:hypothetical protein